MNKSTSNKLFRVLNKYVDLPQSCIELRLTLHHSKNARVEVDYYDRDDNGALILDHHNTLKVKTVGIDIEELLK